jgi:hypothetical protein
MNSWPTNENDAGQILTVALSVLLDVCGEGGRGDGCDKLNTICMWISNLLNINYKVQNIRKCKLKETLNNKLESDVMYSKNDICFVKMQAD